MKYIVFILSVTLGLLSCSQEPDLQGQRPANEQVSGESSARTSGLNPVAFKEAEFINALPDGRQLTFVEPEDGFGFASASQGFGFTNSFSPNQVDQSQLSYGSGDLSIEDQQYTFQLVSCITYAEQENLFPGSSPTPELENYLLITALGGSGTPESENFESSYVLIITLPQGINGDFQFPDERYEESSIVFYDYVNARYYWAMEAEINITGAGISLTGTFTGAFSEVNGLSFSGTLTCGS